MTDHEKHFDREQLFAYAHHFPVTAAESEVREHVARCAPCGQTVMEFQKLDVILDEWQPAAPSAWFDARVRSTVASTGSVRSAFTLFGLRWAQVFAPACLVVLVTAASLIISNVHHTGAPGNVVQQISHTVKSPAAQVDEELTLYKDLPVLEDKDYDMLANFDVLSELPHGEAKVDN